MSSQLPTVGECAQCGTTLSRVHLLIEYETNRGPDAFAECPQCLDVVHARRS